LTDPQTLIQRWLHDCVLALELCPFAAPVLRDQSLRIAICEAEEPEGQLQYFLAELDRLQGSTEAEISTTLLAFTGGPEAFEDFLDLVEQAQLLLEGAQLKGLVQLAHFHPHYQFANEPEGDPSHYTNRSPLPVIHLLRESMMSRAIETYPDPEAIPGRNIARLRALGLEEIERRWRALQQD
jgi:hypothetical protein